jgi:hypothetical protein
MQDFIVTVRRPGAILSRRVAVRAMDGAEASSVAVARAQLRRGRPYQAVGIVRARGVTPRDYGF